MTTIVDLLRHGEPEGGRRYRGRRDDPLSDAGWAQMRAAVPARPPWRRVVTSPLRRCREFAAELAAGHDLALEVEEGLREIDFGAWEGLRAEEIEARDGEALRRYYDDPWRHTPPDGEPLARFQARVESAWRALLARHGGEHLLLVCHAGVMRVVLAHVLELPRRRLFALHIPHACASRVRIDGGHASLLFHNGDFSR